MTLTRPVLALVLIAVTVSLDGADGLAQGQGGRGGAPPVPLGPPPVPLIPNAEPRRTCESLATVSLPDTRIDSAVVDPGDQTTPPTCRVTATITHPPAGDAVTVWVGLPLKQWNGRFQGMGGGGFSGGNANSLRVPLLSGYAAGATDTGHTGGSGSFALDAQGRLNWHGIRDNAHVGIHEMTVTSKHLIEAFYGHLPRYSYFNGCSTGGRQGLSEAQRYPDDYDGVLSGAPAINWTKLHVEQLWGTLLMLETKHAVPSCRYAAATTAAVAACDGLDGVTDGVLEDPRQCTYDPKALVGTSSGDCGTFTEEDAAIVRAIWDGPRARDGRRLWYGLERGGDFMGLSGTAGEPLAPRPNGITLDWWRYFLTQDPKWDFTTLTRAGYEQFWDQSVEQFSDVFATDNPDLSAFRARGGRIVMWHGWWDQLIYPHGTIDYYERVQQAMGGPARTSEFFRLYMAPGVGHCAGGPGPPPSGHFEALVRWVEEKRAPDTLDAIRRDQAGAVIRSRKLCPYPQMARYVGKGSTDQAENFVCQ